MAKGKIFVSERIYTGLHDVLSGYVRIDGSKITEVGEGVPQFPEGEYDLVELGRDIVIPGLIDLHVHGGFGSEVPCESVDKLAAWSRKLAEHGTTAFQPTSGSFPVSVTNDTIAMVRDFTRGPLTGARSLGLHMEGPFLNAKRKGVMIEEYILNPDLDLMKSWLEIGEGTVNYVTVAPELPGALELISYLYRQGVVVSAGHTDATYEEMVKGLRAGITMATHTYNAMRGLHHREPGAIGAVLVQKGVTCELIADGIHIHEGAMKLLLAAKGPDRTCLITDGGMATGMAPGRYVYQGREVIIDDDGKCYLPDGTISGSTIVMMESFKNSVKLLDVPFKDAVRMATVNPAKIVGADSKGSLMSGKDADLVVINDDFEVKWCLVEGEIFKES